jgi:hypothetical protein
MQLDTLKARIGRADYVVDIDAVAEAIVRRLMAPARERGAAAEHKRPFQSGGVLEAG